MPKQSAGLVMYRRKPEGIEVLLVHPGGPFWTRKDAGAWSIPKGEYGDPEPVFEAALREFNEETGFKAEGPYMDIGSVKQARGKIVTAWAFEGECDPSQLVSNFCSLEWPPRTGRQIMFPEIDRGGWFPIAVAREKILKSQAPFLDRIVEVLTPR